MRLFERFNQVGTTVLIASHDLDLIDRIGAPVISLRDGKLVHDDFETSNDETERVSGS